MRSSARFSASRGAFSNAKSWRWDMTSGCLKNGCMLAVLGIGFLFLQSPARAQNTADVVGTVTDASGGAIPNAKVTITNLGTSAARTMNTGSAGDYAFTLLPVGSYSVSVEVNGFKTF